MARSGRSASARMSTGNLTPSGNELNWVGVRLRGEAGAWRSFSIRWRLKSRVRCSSPRNSRFQKAFNRPGAGGLVASDQERER